MKAGKHHCSRRPCLASRGKKENDRDSNKPNYPNAPFYFGMDALQNSFRLQADLAFLIVMAREWNASLSDLVKGSIKNDLLVSGSLLDAAFRGAYHTAMINVKYMKQEERRHRSEKAMEELRFRFDKGEVHAG